MPKHLVVLSGGQDSTTVLALLKNVQDRFSETEIHTITFDYNQVHNQEIKAADYLACLAKVSSHQQYYLNINSLTQSSLLANNHSPNKEKLFEGLPKTFVPGRNMLFLTCAAIYGQMIGCKNIWIGVNAVDYSGYPDCRPDFTRSFDKTINLAFGFSPQDKDAINICTPLISMSKAEIVRAMFNTGYFEWYKYTHTCYRGNYPPCGECDACKLRAKGFADAGYADPLIERESNNG